MKPEDRELPEAETKEAKKRAKALAKDIDRLLVEIQATFQPTKRMERLAYRSMVGSFRSELRKVVRKLDPAYTRTQIETLVKRLLWVLAQDWNRSLPIYMREDTNERERHRTKASD